MRRYPHQGWIAGVCEGIAVHFDWNPRMVRLIAVLLLIFTAFWPLVIAYLVAWYLLEPAEAPPARGAGPAADPPAAPADG
ncbi:MAG: PspC domain-containing protein, partial [Gammaproteobacteria bacterium]|nr:PspC domain-containing protein [Gammaproteobacteria bacterium]